MRRHPRRPAVLGRRARAPAPRDAAGLDEIRDDDSALATRWFDWLCCPGHPYGRTSLGTEQSLERIDRGAAAALWKREVVANNLVIGLAGDIDESAADAHRPAPDRAHSRPAARAPRRSRTPATRRDARRGRRLILVDKPDRTQAQLRIGHLALRYGHPDTAALGIAEAVFGGMFSSRLMQEIRVKRGWSYGAGCALRRSRMPHWFEIWTAAAIEVAGPAVALTLDLLADYAAHGPTDDEVDFARSYLVGAMPFHVATARQRMQLAVRDAVFELPAGYTSRLPEAFAQLSAGDVRAACTRHLRPEDAVTVAVTTAEQAQRALAAGERRPDDDRRSRRVLERPPLRASTSARHALSNRIDEPVSSAPDREVARVGRALVQPVHDAVGVRAVRAVLGVLVRRQHRDAVVDEADRVRELVDQRRLLDVDHDIRLTDTRSFESCP